MRDWPLNPIYPKWMRERHCHNPEQGRHLGGAGGGGATEPPPKPQLTPHTPQSPRSNSSWFSIIPTEIQMCHHFNIIFSYILYFFFFFFFLWLRQGRSQGRLASDKKLIFKGSPALLELILILNFCWNTLLMWLQKAHRIAQKKKKKKKKCSRGGLTAANPPRLGSLRSPSCLCRPPPPKKKKNLKWRPWPRGFYFFIFLFLSMKELVYSLCQRRKCMMMMMMKTMIMMMMITIIIINPLTSKAKNICNDLSGHFCTCLSMFIKINK